MLSSQARAPTRVAARGRRLHPFAVGPFFPPLGNTAGTLAASASRIWGDAAFSLNSSRAATSLAAKLRARVPIEIQLDGFVGFLMQLMMEAFVAKRLGILPKKLESRVLAQVELQKKLWGAVPMRAGENLQSWYPRVARELTNVAAALGFDVHWTARRVRAFWNGEARRIDHHEIITLNQRISSAKAAENRHQKEAHDIRESLEVGRQSISLDGGPPQRLRE